MTGALPSEGATWRADPLCVPEQRFTIEARFYQKLAQGKVQCRLCPRGCTVADGERGFCGVRENREGTLYSLVYARISALQVDPIEKKPLFQYLPGSLAFSVGTAGCNVDCKFCQNWELAHARPEQVTARYLPPKRAAERAALYGCRTIAYTYNEPAIFSEFVIETAEAGHAAGIRSVAVSNGFVAEETLRAVYGKMDAVKIDLKAFSDSFYRRTMRGRLKPVLETLVTLRTMGKWLEIVYLVVPSLNDSDAELAGLARWLKRNLGTEVPLHFTRFYPEHLLKSLPATPVGTLERAREIARAEGLQFVYLGNVPGHPAENTYCPRCDHMLVERTGFAVRAMRIRDGSCADCGHPIPGVWQG